MASREIIEVTWQVADGTTCVDRFTAAHSPHTSVQVFPDGRGLVELMDGADEHGPVRVILYARVSRMVRRPLT